MELELGFLADSAQASPDGKLFALGIGIDRVLSKEFPAVHPMMALVLKFKLHPSECDEQHAFEIELWNPDGQPGGVKIDGNFSSARPEAGKSGFVQLVVNLGQLRFETPGDYSFEVRVDKHHLKSIPLSLGVQPELST